MLQELFIEPTLNIEVNTWHPAVGLCDAESHPGT